MHADKNQVKDYETLARLLSGELSGQEEKEARAILLADPGKKAMHDELTKYWELMETPNRQEAVDTDKAWEQLNKRLASDGLLPAQGQPPRVNLFPVWMRVAASIVLLAVAGTLLFTNILNRKGPDIFAVNATTDSQTLVQFLHDGSVVYLAENTRLSYPERFDTKNRRVSLEGEAFFDVTSSEEQPFLVETRTATIQVLGTSFNLKSDGEDHFELYVEEGRVRVSPHRAGGRSMEVEQGEMLVYTGGRFERSRPQDQDLTWRMSRMHFKDESLENVLQVINRNFNTNLQSDPSVSQRRMTVTFYRNTVPTIIELISMSMNLEVEEKGDSILFRPHI
jgi:transmembrane sensor